MAFLVGQFTQFDDTNSILDPVIAASAKVINLPRNKGAFYQAMAAPLAAIQNIEFEIYNRTKTAKEGTVGDGAGTGWDIDDVTGLTVSADFAKGVTVGHVVRVQSEVLIVSAVNRTTNTISVFARGAGGTTAATHADTTAIKVIGYAGKDTMLKDVESISENTGVYKNYCQTMFETLDWTFQAQNLARKGVPANMIESILTQEALIRVAENISSSAVIGLKQAGTKTGSPYMSAGLFSQLADTGSGSRPTLSYNASGGLTEAKLRAALKEVMKTGTPDTIVLNSTHKEVVNGFIGSTASVANLNTIQTLNNRVGGFYLTQYDYDGQVLNFLVDQDVPSDKIAIVTMNKCQKGFLINDGLRPMEEPAASSREKRSSIQGSLGFMIEDVGYDHTYIYGITG